MTYVSLAEVLVVLAYDGDGGSLGDQLDYGLSGALLTDLNLGQRIALVSGHVAVIDSTPVGHPLIDSVLGQIQSDRPRDPRDWVVRLTKNLRPAVVGLLIQTDMLREESGALSKILPRARYRASDGLASPIAAQALEYMRAAVTAVDEIDPQTVALCALVSALGWEGRLLRDLPREQVVVRFAEMRRLVWTASIVKDIIDDGRAGPWGPTASKIMRNLEEYR